ncbi:MAG: glycosyltransferase family 4 protein, partial [Armatimonadetes bacterium]|nr:glycosyltransferase family 4 protein [Anaerolineae bacterium]
MRLLLITSYYAPDAGAAAVRLTRLATQLAARGHQVTVLTAMPHYPQGRIADGYRGRLTMTETLDGVRVVRVWLHATPSPKISRRLLSQLSLMLMLMVRGIWLPRPDVMLIEAQPMFTNFAGALLGVLKRVPYVQNVSDLWPDHLLSVGSMTATHPVYRLARALTDAAYRGAAGIAAMSPAWAASITRYTDGRAQPTVIYNGVDLTRFAPTVDGMAFKQQHGLVGKRIVAFIGAFTTQNDFPTLLALAERLRSRPDVLVVLVGGGAQESLVTARLAQGDLPNLRWLGWLEYAQLP